MLAEMTGASGSVMMLAHGNMRVSHVTTHVALADVPARLTTARLRYVIERTVEALVALDVPRRVSVSRSGSYSGEASGLPH